MIGIYKFTNKITGESYIGQSKNISRRYQEHKKSSGNDTYFHRMLKHYGFWNFDFEVLEECSPKELDGREKYYISKFRTKYPNGYNKDSGGRQPDKHTNRLTSIEDVNEIIYMLQRTALTITEIARKFSVSPQFISQINTGKCWVQEDIQYPIRDCSAIKKKNIYCDRCGKKITKENSKTGLCNSCYKLTTRKVENRPCKEDLYDLLIKHSFAYVGKLYGVTDNAVRKWCESYGIPKNSKYYRSVVC